MKPQSVAPALDITAASLHDVLERGEAVQLIDVRSSGEFAGSRIAGAKLIPLHEVTARKDELRRDIPVVCICQSGGRSAKAAQELARAGFAVSSLAAGMNGWGRAQLPMEKDAGAPWALERQVRLAAGTLILLGIGLGWFAHAGFFILSAFVGAGLMFAGVTDWCGMGLLLARAPWNRRG